MARIGGIRLRKGNYNGNMSLSSSYPRETSPEYADPLLSLYHPPDTALAPEEIACRVTRFRLTFKHHEHKVTK